MMMEILSTRSLRFGKQTWVRANSLMTGFNVNSGLSPAESSCMVMPETGPDDENRLSLALDT